MHSTFKNGIKEGLSYFQSSLLNSVPMKANTEKIYACMKNMALHLPYLAKQTRS